ncbi:uncharacterized protein [Gorilla gorilla gorilla]|uniref:uncharacterized protein n=1 Tax=Gorilla gorilla gorilla TaxID=9595 RepID=UPI0008F5493B
MDLRRLLRKLQSKLLYSAYSKLCRMDFSVQRPWTSASKTNLHHNGGGISQHKGLRSQLPLGRMTKTVQGSWVIRIQFLRIQGKRSVEQKESGNMQVTLMPSFNFTAPLCKAVYRKVGVKLSTPGFIPFEVQTSEISISWELKMPQGQELRMVCSELIFRHHFPGIPGDRGAFFCG